MHRILKALKPLPLLCLSCILLTGCHSKEKAKSTPSKERASRDVPAKDQPPFDAVGVWQITAADGKEYFITLAPEGAAAQFTSTASDRIGRWEPVGKKIYIFWSDGSTAVLAEENGKIIRSSYGADASPQGQSHDRAKATKIKGASKKDGASAKRENATWGQWVIRSGCDKVTSLRNEPPDGA